MPRHSATAGVSPSRDAAPFVYMLHGYTGDDGKWFGLVDHWIELPPIVDAALADADTREMIIVMPNAYTRFRGNMYSSLLVTGDWESFIAEDRSSRGRSRSSPDRRKPRPSAPGEAALRDTTYLIVLQVVAEREATLPA